MQNTRVVENFLFVCVLQAYQSLPTFLVVHTLFVQWSLSQFEWQKYTAFIHLASTVLATTIALLQQPPLPGLVVYLLLLLLLKITFWIVPSTTTIIPSTWLQPKLWLPFALALLLCQNALLSWCPFFRAYTLVFYLAVAALHFHPNTKKWLLLWDIAASLFNLMLLIRVFLLLHIWEQDAIWRIFFYTADFFLHFATPAHGLPLYIPSASSSSFSPIHSTSAPSLHPQGSDSPVQNHFVQQERFTAPPMIQMSSTPTQPPKKPPQKRILTGRF